MKIEKNVALRDHTTFRIGGPADYFIRVETLGELIEALSFARRENLPFLVLGEGSNILVSDQGFRGVVVQIALKGISFEEKGGVVYADAAAGERWDDFVALCVQKGYGGLENLSGIPGTVGATPIQNVGAYGVEVKEAIDSVRVLDSETAEAKDFSPEECKFGYRDSIFKTESGKKYVVLSVRFRLSRENFRPVLSYRDLVQAFAGKGTPTLGEIREAVLQIRSGKFPDLSVCGTAGSFFKNPILSEEDLEQLRRKFKDIPVFALPGNRGKIALAWILEKLGWKGRRAGDIGAYEKQPLVLVNYGSAHARDVEAFARAIEQDVLEKTGIAVEREVRSC